MRAYPVVCVLSNGSELTVPIKAGSDAQAILEARIVLASQKAVHYQVMAYVKEGRKTVERVIFDSRTEKF